jgi:hypothetical protein
VSQPDDPWFGNDFICVVTQMWLMVEISSIYIVCFVGAREISVLTDTLGVECHVHNL